MSQIFRIQEIFNFLRLIQRGNKFVIKVMRTFFNPSWLSEQTAFKFMLWFFCLFRRCHSEFASFIFIEVSVFNVSDKVGIFLRNGVEPSWGGHETVNWGLIRFRLPLVNSKLALLQIIRIGYEIIDLIIELSSFRRVDDILELELCPFHNDSLLDT